MNWDAIGAIGEVVGAAAVFISFLYLGTQIRNSKRSDQVNAAAQAASATNLWLGQIVQNTELNSVYVRGTFEYESLNQEEKNRFTLLIMQLLRMCETVWKYKKIGLVDSDYWASIESTLERIVGSAGARLCYQHNNDTLSAGFVSVVDEILSRDSHVAMVSTTSGS